MLITKDDNGNLIFEDHMDSYFDHEDPKDELTGEEIDEAAEKGASVVCESLAEWKMNMHQLGFPDDTFVITIIPAEIKIGGRE